ncbi:MetQ/NlpA family ABC transporter substrate-binding protein [Bhargavaea ginsengi]|uniref:MetQ/NlpA family ABC transporter substrate-binding protein n=1 Tax=Bhargavaea ginsengi TaxID=426757 RepID=UPI00203A93D6|nr:MetQ/NlpA family ABC transporter substrate-binding protein [Bhargavaea ginsengi]MCM3087989.1 MetQ/NlpA family ABC transporter substrate-binding protein [Bhargavaea ginsengi]
MKRVWILAIALIASLALAACGGAGASNGDGETVKVKIGVNGSDGAQWPILKEKAAKEGIEIELVEFADYTLPNNALAQGDIDLNAFQTIAFFAQYVKESGNDLEPIGSTVFAPMGLYSEKIKDVSELKQGDKIAIPDDPTNQARALLLLESAGLITLADDFGLFDDPSKIAENKLDLELLPMTAQQTPRVLPDVAASVINNGIAGQAGFSPAEDAIFKEDETNEDVHPYVNIIAASAEDKDNETYKRIVELYQEEDVAKAITDDTNGGSVLIKLTQDQLVGTFEDLKK